jgi:hypothetical protein
MVTSTTTGATVLRMDTVQPGTYSVSVRLGPRRGGDNTFRIVAGDLDPFDIVIVGN